jgi:hypothetical protein
MTSPSKATSMPLDRPSLHFARRPAIATEESRFSRARELAAQIDDLLESATASELEATGYAVRLAQGLTRSLIDQLDELHRGASSSRHLPAEAAAKRDRRD